MSSGSSPLTRGKLRRRGCPRCQRRLIPAHAGKTARSRPQRPRCRAHPRSRGENGQDGHDEGAPAGSSPLTRGKLLQLQSCQNHERLIPAHAGKTMRSSIVSVTSGAHPRSRGENWHTVHVRYLILGSSPLTRGKPIYTTSAENSDRLIPAHAGKTWFPCRRRSIRWAHPRSRGENNAARWTASCVTGSSPLTRGKLPNLTIPSLTNRLIPAHAGKTAAPALVRPSRRAHPRSRGENSHVPEALPVREGSSPLTRGKPEPVGHAV